LWATFRSWVHHDAGAPGDPDRARLPRESGGTRQGHRREDVLKDGGRPRQMYKARSSVTIAVLWRARQLAHREKVIHDETSTRDGLDELTRPNGEVLHPVEPDRLAVDQDVADADRLVRGEAFGASRKVG
jgi:hypothetical protein